MNLNGVPTTYKESILTKRPLECFREEREARDLGVLAREFYNEELTRKRSKTVVTDEKEAVWVDRCIRSVDAVEIPLLVRGSQPAAV